VCLSLTASAETTYQDSLSRAFDNCVYLHDSLQHELKQAKELALFDSAHIVENVKKIGELKYQVKELKEQIESMQAIMDKQAKDYKRLQKSAKKELIKSKIKTWLIAPASAVGGFVVGYLIGKFLQ
jgi:chromosome condensin MukBEF complex kleisin-like MukF subunit